MPHLSFVQPLPTDNKPIPIRYVATLDPPMPVSDEISQKLMTVAGLLDGTTITDGKTKESSQTHSLEEMLVMGIDKDALNDNNTWVSVSHYNYK